MAVTNVDMNYLDVFAQNDIWNYTFTGSSAEEIKDNGKLYYDSYTGTWYRDFIMESDGTKTKIPIAMDITVNEDESYTFTPKAIVRQRTLEELIDKNARANGIEYDKRGINGIKNAILNLIESKDNTVPHSILDAYNNGDSDIIGFIYDEFGNLTDVTLPEYIDTSLILNADPDFFDWLWELDHDVFGEDISHKYTEEQITRPIGENVITPYAKENLQNAVAALIQDEKTVSGGYSADFLHDFINNNLLNSDDADIQAVLSYDNFRIMTRSTAPEILYLDIIGYNIDNNIGVVSDTDRGQSVAVTITSGKYVVFHITSSTIFDTSTGSVPTNLSVRVYNYQTGDSVSDNGFTTGPRFWSINDTIGVSADRKPYDLTPNYTYPSTPPHYEHISDIDDDPETPTPKPQNYWIIGIPNPNPVIKIIPSPNTPPIIPKDVPSEETTPVPPTTNMLKGMCNVYKPNDTQVSSLNTFLWTDSTIDDLTQLWKNNPLEGVVAYHELYFDAETFGEKFIKLGTVIASDVGNVPTVAQRFQTLHCGYKPIKRYFNDKRDYDTKISIYLPFVGIRDLDVNEVMDSDLYVDYNIDVVTGDCTANLSVNRKTSSGTTLQDKKCIAMFDGNCSSPIPLSSADRSRLYSSILSGAVGVVGSLGNPIKAATGIISSAVGIATQHQVSIQKSGNIGGNKGAMAFKKPYLIIERPIPVDASERGKMLGRPCNYTVKLNNVSGYTECKAVHVETITNATDVEKAQIENILKSGIIL